MREPTKDEIEAGAKALRERQMAGKITRPWETLPKGDKLKWQLHSETVLRAALRLK